MELNYLLETSRLIIRRFSMEDKLDLFEIVSDPKTCSDDGGYQPYQAVDEKYLQLCNFFCEQKKRYSVILKETKKCIGMINLMDEERAVSCLEMGYVLAKDYRGKGYGYEMTEAMISRLFLEHEVEMVTASIFEFNIASRGLLKKLGFVLEGITHKALNHSIYGPIDLIDFYLPIEVWQKNHKN